MLDHIGLSVGDVTDAKKFFSRALKPLGYEELMDFEYNGKRYVGFGIGGKPDFWIQQGTATQQLHVAFRAEKRALVDAFYKAALTAGGEDNGKPGLRPHYHEHYYGAFVLYHGLNVEAVSHTAE